MSFFEAGVQKDTRDTKLQFDPKIILPASKSEDTLHINDSQISLHSSGSKEIEDGPTISIHDAHDKERRDSTGSSAEDSLLSIPPLTTKSSRESLNVNFARDVSWEDEITPRPMVKTRKKSNSFGGFEHPRTLRNIKKSRSMFLDHESNGFKSVPPILWKLQHLKQWLRANNLEEILDSLLAHGIRDGRSLLKADLESLEKVKQDINGSEYHRFVQLRIDFLNDFRIENSPRQPYNFSFTKSNNTDRSRKYLSPHSHFDDDQSILTGEFITAVGAAPQIGENSVQGSLYRYPSRPHSNWGEAAASMDFGSPGYIAPHPKKLTVPLSLPTTYYYIHCYFFACLSSIILFFHPSLSESGEHILKPLLAFVLLLCFVCCTYLWEIQLHHNHKHVRILLNRVHILCCLISCFFMLGLIAFATSFDSVSDFMLLLIGVLSIVFFFSKSFRFFHALKPEPGEDNDKPGSLLITEISRRPD